MVWIRNITLAFLSLFFFSHMVSADLVYSDDFNDGATASPWGGDCVVIGNESPIFDGGYMYCSKTYSTNFFTVPTGNTYPRWRLEFEVYDPNDDSQLGFVFGCGNDSNHQYASGISMQEYLPSKGFLYSIKQGTDYIWSDFPQYGIRDQGWHHVVLISDGVSTNFTILQNNGRILSDILPVNRACHTIVGYANGITTPFRIDNIALYNDTSKETAPTAPKFADVDFKGLSFLDRLAIFWKLLFS